MGEVSEAQIVAALVRAGFVVLKPLGDNQRYDLVLDEKGKFSRVQVKTGRIKRGAIRFPTSSSCRGSRGRRTYHGEVEYFGVFVPEINRSYLIPVEVTGRFSCNLRVAQPQNNHGGLHWAEDFELLVFPQAPE